MGLLLTRHQHHSWTCHTWKIKESATDQCSITTRRSTDLKISPKDYYHRHNFKKVLGQEDKISAIQEACCIHINRHWKRGKERPVLTLSSLPPSSHTSSVCKAAYGSSEMRKMAKLPVFIDRKSLQGWSVLFPFWLIFRTYGGPNSAPGFSCMAATEWF